MASTHAWELPEAGATAPQDADSQHPWEGSGDAPGPGLRPWEAGGQSSEGQADAEQLAARLAAGHELAELLIQLNVEGKLSAKDTCLLSHWAFKAGAQGPVRDLAYRSGGTARARSGHYQRHLDRVVGLRGNSGDFYHVQVPGHTKHSRSRVAHVVKVFPPHERLHKEVSESPEILAQARDMVWPTSFEEHKVVRAAPAGGPPVIPLAFYLDGAQYTKGGASVLIFVVCNLVSGARHLVAVLKKKDMCKCGCRGWCSVRPIMQFLHWSFAALARGVFPVATHEGEPWPETDEYRFSQAGKALVLTAAVQQVRGDWAEFSHTLGFPTWKHMDYPCLWCRADKDSMYAWGDLRERELAWEENDEASYEAACQRCEIHVTIQTIAQRDRVAALLFYDKKIQGSHGRALKGPVPELRLKRGDRLEPCPGLPDVGAFDSLGAPASVVFWRPSQETITRHRNPLFDDSIGLNIQSLRVDSLHCLYLGVIQTACGAVIQAMLEHDCFGALAEGCTTAESKLQLGLQRFSAGLQAWSRGNRHLGLTEVSTEITVPLRVKGGEAKTILLYMVDMLPGVAPVLPKGDAMVQCLVAIKANISCLSGPLVWSRAAQEDCNISGPSYLQPLSLDCFGQFGSKFGWRVVAFLAHCRFSSGLPDHPGRGPQAHGHVRPRCPQMPCLAAHGQDQQTTRPLAPPSR